MSNEANLACMLSQSLRLTGLLNLDAFQAALKALVIRHESLRATFSGDGKTILITKSLEFQSPVIDISGMNDRAQQQEIAKYQALAVSETFDLTHCSLFATKIIKLDDREHVIILIVHHLICDGWSLGILISDLARIYTNLERGINPDLEPPAYFSEYAFLEQAKIGSQESLDTAAYWLKKFAIPPVLDLPTDYPRPPLRTFNSACENYVLKSSLLRSIEQLGIDNGCSLMTTLLAAFEVFLYKITGKTELIVGVPTSGQVAAGKYKLVGHCVNFLPCRSRIDPESKFTEYLRLRNGEILDDYEHQDFTYGSLLQKLSIPRDASRIPLISAVFNIDLNDDSQSLFKDLDVETTIVHSSFATFEFFLNAAITSDRSMVLDCQYNTNLFNAATIHRRLTEFENLLTQIVETAGSIGKLSLLSSIEQQQLLVEWNNNHTNYPQAKCIHQLFEERVEIEPEAIALVFEQQQLTYRELNNRSNQLANYLIELGVQPDELIGMAIDRSIDTIVSILGILKAGGAYLPLDLAYPPERLSFMLENANVSILLTKKALVDKLPTHQARVLCLDTDWEEIARSNPTNPHCLVRSTNLQPIRQLIAGGDVLSVPHVQKVLANLPNCQLINGYGPTENTTFTCCYPIVKTDTLLTSIPIGRPISNTQVYILDAYLQPVPIGIPGQLYIGGDGLARGYLDRPELTAEKFIPHPFSTGKLYKTGDLARYLPDGNIEFLGRIDSQVKIRGFRVEPGEIEAQLAQHPNVREVAVIDREDRPGNKTLVAYLVCPQVQPTARELRTFLRSRLPDYLIPSAFVTLDALPLTPNGKIDRRALPAPEFERSESPTARVSPRNDLELQLTEIWERLLGVRSIGIRDNFFELGGHSLIAVRLFAEIEQIWGQNLPLATLFQKQTIAELADVLREEEWSAPWSSLLPIQSGGNKPPLFCIHPIGGNVLEYYTLANYLDRDRPIYGLQSQGLDGKQPPLRRVEDMASHYIQEIRTVQPHGPYYLLGYSFGGLVAYEIARQLMADGEKIDLLALLDCGAPNLPNLRPSSLQSTIIHLSNLWQLNFQERSSYILGRIAYRFRTTNERDFLAKSLYKPEDLTPQLLNILVANLQADEDYVARSYLGKLTLFRCQVQDMEHYLHPEFGWGDLVAGLAIHHVPGSHFTMMKEPRISTFSEKLKLYL